MSCRICLTTTVCKDMTLQDTYYVEGEPKCGLEIMQFCLNIEVKQKPVKLCLKCYRKLICFYKFKILALKNQLKYNKVEINFDSDKEVKLETEDTSSDKELDDIKEEEETVAIVKKEEEFENIIAADVFSDSDDEVISVIKKHKEQISLKKSDVQDSYNKVTEALSTRTQTLSKSDEVKPVKKKRGRPKNLTPTKSKSQQCQECGKTVKNLSAHILLHKPPDERKRIPCLSCNKTFLSYGARYKHNKYRHLGVKKECPICKKVMVNLQNHMKIKHNYDKLKHVCRVCDRRFTCRSLLEGHMTIHTSQKPHACSDCGKVYRLKQSLIYHKKRVHDKEKSHLCHFCSKGFFSKSGLQLHLRSHTKEKPFKCRQCDKAFRTSSQRRTHETIHTGIKLKSCTLCDMTFYNSGALNTHMISHTKERKHECKYCGTKFLRSDHKKRHERTAHERNIPGAMQMSREGTWEF